MHCVIHASISVQPTGFAPSLTRLSRSPTSFKFTKSTRWSSCWHNYNEHGFTNQTCYNIRYIVNFITVDNVAVCSQNMHNYTQNCSSVDSASVSFTAILYKKLGTNTKQSAITKHSIIGKHFSLLTTGYQTFRAIECW